MPADTAMDSQVLYALRSDLWNSGAAVLLDGGEFPMGRIPEIAQLVSRVRVVADHGAIAALREAGVTDVSEAPGSTLADALQATGQAQAPVVFSGTPKKSADALLAALSSMTDATGTQLPVAAIMFMRDESPGEGPLCPLAETSFVSGYGALFSILLASRTGRSVKVVAPRADRLKATHAEVVKTALELARQTNTKFEVVADPAPRSWAIDHSDSMSAVFCGVLEAQGKSSGGGGKIARHAGPETETAVKLLEGASCDVVVVLDRVSLVRGPSAGVQVAKVIGAAMVGTVALTGVAGPAAAAQSPPAAARTHVQAKKTSKNRQSGPVEDQAVTDSAGAAAGSSGAEPGQQAEAPSDLGATAGAVAAAAAAGAGAQADTDTTAPPAAGDTSTETAEPDVNVGDAGGVAVDEPDAGGVAVDEPDAALEESVDFGGDKPQSDIEAPIEYIAFNVWTDSGGNTHVISSGLQDHPVEVPPLPDWAIRDGGDHPWLAKTDPDYVDPAKVAASKDGNATDGNAQAKREATQQQARQDRASRHQGHNKHNRNRHKAHNKKKRNKKHKANKNGHKKHRKNKANKHKHRQKHRHNKRRSDRR